MIQTKNNDAYKSSEFLDILAGKHLKTKCKVFEYLKRQGEHAVDPISHNTYHTKQIPSEAVDTEHIKVPQQRNNKRAHQVMFSSHLSTMQKIQVNDIKGKIEKDIKIDDVEIQDATALKQEIKANNRQITLFRPVCNLQWSVYRMSCEILYKAFQLSIAIRTNTYKIENPKTLAEQESPEEHAIKEIKPSITSERALAQKDVEDCLEHYQRNKSFIRAYVVELNKKAPSLKKTATKVTFKRFVEVIEYYKPDYKKPLFDYEYDLK